jgi:hypothetical protein
MTHTQIDELYTVDYGVCNHVFETAIINSLIMPSPELDQTPIDPYTD